MDGDILCRPRHEQAYHWTVDHAPRRRVIRWLVVPSGLVVSAEKCTDRRAAPARDRRASWAILAGLRCPGPGGRFSEFGWTTWPSYMHATDRTGRVRRRLIEAFGPTCILCREKPGEFIDHDHITGLVRGYLCRECNGQIDWCPHFTGCRYQAYLDNPRVAEEIGVGEQLLGRWVAIERSRMDDPPGAGGCR